MKEKNYLIDEMLATASFTLSNHETAIKAIRALCKWYGGQQIYFPKIKLDSSEIGKEIVTIMCKAVGNADATRVMTALMPLFGGVQIYIPFESRAFRKIIAREIYDRYTGSGESKAELCREYSISFTQMYRLYHEVEAEKRQISFDFL